MGSIFISYRRIDAGHFAARLYDALKQNLGPDEVFLDVEDIEVTTDWKDRLGTELSYSKLIVVIIGDLWLKELVARKELPEDDQVLWEIQSAINQKKTIFPLLINGIGMPRSEDLPSSIALLTSFQNTVLHSTKSQEFETVVQKIINALAAQKPRSDGRQSPGLGLSQQ